jgi:hypothetical protein
MRYTVFFRMIIIATEAALLFLRVEVLVLLQMLHLIIKEDVERLGGCLRGDVYYYRRGRFGR